MSDFRPISFFNLIYKYITKISANKLKLCLANEVTKNQTPLIPNKFIAENISLAQELVKKLPSR